MKTAVQRINAALDEAVAAGLKIRVIVAPQFLARKYVDEVYFCARYTAGTGHLGDPWFHNDTPLYFSKRARRVEVF